MAGGEVLDSEGRSRTISGNKVVRCSAILLVHIARLRYNICTTIRSTAILNRRDNYNLKEVKRSRAFSGSKGRHLPYGITQVNAPRLNTIIQAGAFKTNYMSQFNIISKPLKASDD